MATAFYVACISYDTNASTKGLGAFHRRHVPAHAKAIFQISYNVIFLWYVPAYTSCR